MVESRQNFQKQKKSPMGEYIFTALCQFMAENSKYKGCK